MGCKLPSISLNLNLYFNCLMTKMSHEFFHILHNHNQSNSAHYSVAAPEYRCNGCTTRWQHKQFVRLLRITLVFLLAKGRGMAMCVCL